MAKTSCYIYRYFHACLQWQLAHFFDGVSTHTYVSVSLYFIFYWLKICNIIRLYCLAFFLKKCTRKGIRIFWGWVLFFVDIHMYLVQERKESRSKQYVVSCDDRWWRGVFFMLWPDDYWRGYHLALNYATVFGTVYKTYITFTSEECGTHASNLHLQIHKYKSKTQVLLKDERRQEL